LFKIICILNEKLLKKKNDFILKIFNFLNLFVFRIKINQGKKLLFLYFYIIHGKSQKMLEKLL
jgi:hypothetical protein